MGKRVGAATVVLVIVVLGSLLFAGVGETHSPTAGVAKQKHGKKHHKHKKFKPNGPVLERIDVPKKTLVAIHRTQVPGEIEPRAINKFPTSFGGTWIGGHGKVVIAFTAAGKKRGAKVLKTFSKNVRPDGKKLGVVTVDDPILSLRTLETRMIDERPRLSVSLGNYDLDVDVRQNAVVATFTDPQTDAEFAAHKERLTGRYATTASQLIVRKGPGTPEQLDYCDSRTHCSPYLRGGLKTVSPPYGDPPKVSGCTIGFNAIRHSDGVPVTISAAHCGAGATTADKAADDGDARYVNSPSKQYGNVLEQSYGGSLDAELASIKSSTGFKGQYGRIFRSASIPDARVIFSGKYSELPVGYPVCKSGITTGETCGKVTSKDYSPSKTLNAKTWVTASYCEDHGDSGGPVYRPYDFNLPGLGQVHWVEALGIVHGRPNTAACGASDYKAVFDHISFVKNQFGVGLYVTSLF